MIHEDQNTAADDIITENEHVFWDIGSIIQSESDFSDNSDKEVKYVFDNSLYITSVILLFLKVSKGMSNKTVELFMKMLRTTMSPINHPTSVKQAHSIVSKNIVNIQSQLFQTDYWTLDLIEQLKAILKFNIKQFLSFRHILINSGNIDIISNSPYLSQCKPFVLHLLLCADGVSIFRSKNDSYWPLQIMILDLPLCIRQKFHNRVLYILCCGKPNWKNIILQLSNDLSRIFSFVVHGKLYEFKLKLYKCIFDLPGLASVCSITQFNGEYGCPFCLHPGVQIKKNRGTCRIYPYWKVIYVLMLRASFVK